MIDKYNSTGKLRNMASVFLICGDNILLLYRENSSVIEDSWVASAGGHFEENEINDAKACAMRELYEELRITEDMIDNLSLRYVTLRRTDKEIRQNYYFFAELNNGIKMNLKSNEGQLKWFSLDEINGLKMPFTAKYVTEHWLDIGRNTTDIYGGIADGEKVVFTEMRAF